MTRWIVFRRTFLSKDMLLSLVPWLISFVAVMVCAFLGKLDAWWIFGTTLSFYYCGYFGGEVRIKARTARREFLIQQVIDLNRELAEEMLKKANEKDDEIPNCSWKG